MTTSMRYLKKVFDAETHMDVLPRLIEHTPRLKDKVVCDFCGGDNVIYVYASNRMSTGEMRQCWRWCACKACSEAADNKRWSELVDKLMPKLKKMIVQHLGSEPTESMLRAAVTTAVSEFRQYAVPVTVGLDKIED